MLQIEMAMSPVSILETQPQWFIYAATTLKGANFKNGQRGEIITMEIELIL